MSGIPSLNTVSSGSMSVLDSASDTSFLVDSWADISVLPVSFLHASQLRPRPGQRLRAANGSSIDTFGKKTISLVFPGFTTKHTFRVAKVAQPLLGADFFRKHSILIDVKANCLRFPDGKTVDSVPTVSYTHLTLPTILLV